MSSPSSPPQFPPVPRPSWRELGCMALLVVAIFVAYSAVGRAGFIWDDNAHLTENVCVVGPLGLKEIWTTASADYFPLVLTNFWALHKFWGLHAAPYHWLNVVLHAANVCLLWLVLRRLRVPGAWLGAALWALHPVQVESVAWISELKNTQSGVFFLLAIWCYTRWLEQPEPRGKRDYIAALLCALAALLSKPSTVMLPVVLVLATWWLRRAWRWRDLVPLAPFYAASAAWSLWTIWEQRVHSRASGPDWSENLAQRFIIAGRVVEFYLGKLAWPEPLVFVYRRWQVDPWNPVAYLAPALVLAALASLWRRREGPFARGVFFAAAAFVALLFPVLGFFNVYYFRYSFVADHFQYLASMAPLALAGALAVHAAPLWRRIAAPAALLALALVTQRQTLGYADNATLWRTILARNPDCWLAHTNYSLMLLREQQNDAALQHAEAAFRLKPDDVSVRHNLGNAQLVQGRVAEAIENFRAALRLDPDNIDTHNSLGYALLTAERWAEAEPELEAAVRGRPNFAVAHRNLATVLAHLDRLPEAIEHWRAALASLPNDDQTWTDLGEALLKTGQAEEARDAFFAVVKLRPSDPGARCNLAFALDRTGRRDLARQEVDIALHLDPSFAPAQQLRAHLLNAP